MKHRYAPRKRWRNFKLKQTKTTFKKINYGIISKQCADDDLYSFAFFMHTGFAFLEIGNTQKNAINILFKNIFIITSPIALWNCWFNLMYPGFAEVLRFRIAGFGLEVQFVNGGWIWPTTGYTYWTDFFFQGMFAATAATIVSGAVNMKIGPFMIFTVLYVGLVYPILGSWKWGGGFATT